MPFSAYLKAGLFVVAAAAALFAAAGTVAILGLLGLSRNLRRRYEIYLFGPSTLLSTIFRASPKASAGVDSGTVAASLNPSSSYIVTMKPAWRVRTRR